MLWNRAPKTAAVTIDRPKGEGVTLTSIMRMRASEIDLKALGIKVKNTWRTKGGGILLEVDAEEGAARLAESLKAAVGVSHLSRTTAVSLLDILDWIEAEDLLRELKGEGIMAEEFTVEEAGITIRTNPGTRGDRITRVNFAIPTVLRLAKTRFMKVGWTKCSVKLLEKKQPMVINNTNNPCVTGTKTGAYSKLM